MKPYQTHTVIHLEVWLLRSLFHAYACDFNPDCVVLTRSKLFKTTAHVNLDTLTLNYWLDALAASSICEWASVADVNEK